MERRLTTGLIISALSCTATAADLGSFPPTASPWGHIARPAVTADDVSAGSEKLYRVWFDNITLEGDLLEHALSGNGAVTSTASWSAKDKLNARSYDSRTVFKGSDSSYDLCTTSASALEKFICGDNSNEQAQGGSYRDRVAKLGTIIHSNPVYVGKPSAGYTFDGYLSFATAKANRPGRIYVGANDGMLHAFDTTGEEVFGFIPSAVESALASWAADASGNHAYFVDGPLVAADAHHNSFSGSSKWKTVLVGGLGAGGKAYFALDVTSPPASTASFSTIAGSKMWEFSPAGMGYTYGAPVIARTNAAPANWVLIAPNGYDQGGEPILFIRDLNDPNTVIKDFDNLLSPATAPQGNGLSSPTAVDINGDFKIDYVYAGDLDGNLWRFDLSGSSTSGWTATRLFTAKDGSNAQPILAAPEVARLGDGTLMVYFGTGDPWNISSASKQTFYALKDDPTAAVATPYTRSNLAQRTLSATSNSNYKTVDESVSPNNTAINWSTQKGWYLDLAPGGHVLEKPKVHAGRAQFMIHDDSSGENWLVEIDYKDGTLPDKVVFDTNGDGILSETGDNIGYVDSDNPGSLVVAVKATADLISGATLAGHGDTVTSYMNSWTAGTAATTSTTTTTVSAPLEAPSCTALGFDRFDFTSEPSSYSIKFIAHLSDDPADDIWIMRSGMDADKRTISSTVSPPAGDPRRGAGSGMTKDGFKTWSGLSMYLGEPGSERVSMLIEYDGPYQIKAFTVEFGNIQLRRIHDGVAACSCENKFKLCGESERIEYGNSHEGVSVFTLANGYNFASGIDPIVSGSDKGNMTTTVTTTTTTPGSAAQGEPDKQLQSGAVAATGRIRWRELTF